MKKMILIGIVLCSTTIAIAQKDQNTLPVLVPESGVSNGTSYSMKSWESITGTYQFIISDSKVKPIHTEELFNLIIGSRKESEELIIEVNQDIKIYIPSIQQIKSSGFIALERIQYSNK